MLTASNTPASMGGRLTGVHPMNKQSLLQSALRGSLAATALALLAPAPAHAAPAKALQFTATGANSTDSFTTLDHPALNARPAAKPILTQRYIGTYNPNPTGLRYNPATSRWQVVNENTADIPLGSAFNILLAPGTKTHLCTPANTYSNRTFILAGKGKPTSLFLATHIVNPVAGIPGTNHIKPFGMWYHPATTPALPYTGKWHIYNEDSQALGTVGFNVADVTKLKAGGLPASFVFTTDGANSLLHVSTITNPLTDGNPNAVVFAKHLFIDGTSEVFLNKEIAVWYNGSKWTIFNEDLSPMPLNAAFVVTVIPTATP